MAVNECRPPPEHEMQPYHWVQLDDMTPDIAEWNPYKGIWVFCGEPAVVTPDALTRDGWRWISVARVPGISTPDAALPTWDDPRVQAVYDLLCDDATPPDPAEHWQGWYARWIVARLFPLAAPVSEAIPEPVAGQVWRSARARVDPRTVARVGPHDWWPNKKCVFYTFPADDWESPVRVLPPGLWRAWARKTGARPV